MLRRILVVEDDILNSAFICTTLETHGYAVRSVSDGAYAIAAARAFQPDLITMDIHLPSVSGLELIRQLKVDPELSAVPVMAITAYVGRLEEKQIRRAGASAYLAKPISMKGLLATTEQLLADGGRPTSLDYRSGSPCSENPHPASALSRARSSSFFASPIANGWALSNPSSSSHATGIATGAPSRARAE